jgi:hypothetical protein
MTTQTVVGRSNRRPALIGFVVGFAMAFVATFLALMFTFFEGVVLDILVPGAALLGPLWDAMADWNGLLNMVLVGLVNGVVYAVVLTLVAAGLAAVRR